MSLQISIQEDVHRYLKNGTDAFIMDELFTSTRLSDDLR